MFGQAFVSVFSDAAVPQKVVLAVLVGAIPGILAARVLSSRAGTRAHAWRRLIADLRGLGPALGLLTGAMTSFHMGLTIQRLPFDPTAKQLAPGILEVSMLIGLGALVGLVAAGAHWRLGRGANGEPAA
jgi:hypothetical protein